GGVGIGTSTGGAIGNGSGAIIRFTGNIAVNRTTVILGGLGEGSGGTYFTGTFSGIGDLVVTSLIGLQRVVFAPSGTNSYGNLYVAGGSTLQLGDNSLSSN